MRWILLPLFCLTSLLSFSARADLSAEQSLETKKIDYQIDWKYKAGEYLVFDCERSHYACVTSEGYENCQEERSFSLAKKEGRLPCAPLKKFKNKKSCVEKNYELVDINALRRFCYPK